MKHDAPNIPAFRISPWRKIVSVCLMPALVLNTLPAGALAQTSNPPSGSPPPTQTYPAPVTTPRHVKANRELPSFTAPAAFHLSAQPSDQEIFHQSLFEEPLVPVGGKATRADNAALAAALTAFSKRTVRDDYSALENYLAANPQSPWRLSLMTNLGWLYRQTGWYSKSLDAWEQVWAAGKNESDPKAKAVIDRALAELIVLNARVGRKDRLEALFKETKGRPLAGSAEEKIEAAQQGYQLMINHPEFGYRCGPMAVEAVRQHWDTPVPFNMLVKNEKSTAQGTSLTQIEHLAHKLSLDMIMARRAPGSAILAPSVINWKVGHFAAVISEDKEKGLVRLHDPTFGDDVWISPQALDAEASGYFLVKNQPLPAGWTAVSEDEGKTVWGKGSPHCSDDTCLTCPNIVAGGCDSCSSSIGMARSSIYEMLASLCVTDTPLFYQPAFGPSVSFTITYNQRDAYQPSTFTYSNLGPRWTFNWLSYITDDPTNPGADVNQYLAGAGVRAYGGYNSSTQTYASQHITGSVLKLTSSSSYELDEPGGSKQIFSVANTASPRKIFLTQEVDPQGNALTYSYDSYYRVVAVTDATGQVTTVSYGSTSSSSPAFYQITTVTDPFGRTATLAYDANGNLASSTDMIGMVSSYHYNGPMTSMTTPYGTTTFDVGQDADKRWVQVTDPQGGRERVETWPQANTNVPFAALVPWGDDSGWIQYRNSFYWNKKAMIVDAGGLNYTDAVITHWMHENDLSIMSGQVESMKKPLESRGYNTYSGEISAIQLGWPVYDGSPGITRQILADGSTQTNNYQYNGLGLLTQSTDPAGRVTNYTYAGNGIDLIQTTQKNGSSNDILSSATYNSQHEPLTSTDASGQTTTYTYNANGTVNTVTDAKGETFTYAYNSGGFLTSVTGPVSGATISMTYDGYGRVRTLTDTNGYTMTYDYDNLDRPTQTTYPDGTIDQNVYTNMDLTLSKDRQNRWTRYLYNPVEQIIGVVDPQGRVTSYERCICGELNAIVDPNGHRTAWGYDIQGRVTSKTYADGSQITYAYDNGYTSRLLSMTDTAGNVTTNTYNHDSTLASTAYSVAPGFAATPTVSYAYDPNYLRLTGMTDGTGTTSYAYSPAWVSGSPITGGNRLHTETGPLGSTAAITYTYDELGRATATSINGVGSNVTYDSLSRVTGATNALGSFSYGYDGVTPKLTSITYPNGQSTSYSYFGATGDFRLSNITNYLTGTTVLSKFDYTYNPVGTIATWQQQTDSNDPVLWTCGYDKADQLTGVTQTNTATSANVGQYVYGYDPAGNRLTEQIGLSVTQASYNNLNQLIGQSAGGPLTFAGSLNKPGTVTVAGNPATMGTGSTNFTGTASVTTGTNAVAVVATNVNGNAATNNYQVVVPSGSGVTPTYDANGNMTNNGNGQTYTWDAKNELITITYTGGAASNFIYDGLNRRVKIVEKNNSGTVTSTKQYIWIGNTIAEERDASNAVTKRLLPQGEQQGGTAYYYTRDHLGSVREMLNSSGTIVARYGYDPYGRTTLASGTNLATFQYTGDYYHQTSGLNLTKYRAFDPNTGRWLSRDRLGDVNLYDYVQNSPLDRIDTSGLVWTEVPGTITLTAPWDTAGVDYNLAGLNGSGHQLSQKIEGLYEAPAQVTCQCAGQQKVATGTRVKRVDLELGPMIVTTSMSPISIQVGRSTNWLGEFLAWLFETGSEQVEIVIPTADDKAAITKALKTNRPAQSDIGDGWKGNVSPCSKL